MTSRVVRCALAPLLIAGYVGPLQAQTSYAPVIITAPIIDAVDENFVSVLSGKAHFTVPAVSLGDVSYIPNSINGPNFPKGGIVDNNYGRIVACHSVSTTSGGYGGRFECSLPSGPGLQVIHGEERASFTLLNGSYVPRVFDGSSFVDGGDTCTWTKRDGTKIVFAAYHASGNLCLSNNVLSVTKPNGRIATYYYHGAFSTTAPSPILSIATNSGYLLKYNYSGTPTRGGHVSVTAINRAFETCDPAAISCSLSNAWPTATLSWQDKMVTTSDDFPPLGTGYDPYRHYLFTIETAAHKRHVFELDSYFRVITYQPPDATGPVYSYKICSLLTGSTHPLRNCFGFSSWPNSGIRFEPQPLLLDLVESTTRNGQTWTYGASFSPGVTPPAYSTWAHRVTNPLGRTMSAAGNATPGMEGMYGPLEYVKHYDGTEERFQRSANNFIKSRLSPAGVLTEYGYALRRNLEELKRTPIANTGDHVIVQSAAYSPTCDNIVTCNQPSSVTDANQGLSEFKYDPVHGGVLKVTGPAVNGVRPQTRYTYGPRYAWYRASNGVMTRETRPIWMLSSESICRTSNASDTGCAAPNDEVVTSYEYGPDSGPNNLLLRGQSISANGVTLRTCYGYDKQGNKLWEAAPNAERSSCEDY